MSLIAFACTVWSTCCWKAGKRYCVSPKPVPHDVIPPGPLLQRESPPSVKRLARQQSSDSKDRGRKHPPFPPAGPVCSPREGIVAPTSSREQISGYDMARFAPSREHNNASPCPPSQRQAPRFQCHIVTHIGRRAADRLSIASGRAVYAKRSSVPETKRGNSPCDNVRCRP